MPMELATKRLVCKDLVWRAAVRRVHGQLYLTENRRFGSCAAQQDSHILSLKARS